MLRRYDGVLCLDPTETENDDGPAYLSFLQTARRLSSPTQVIGHLVTSRLERYRPETEAWLKQHDIRFGKLHMLDVPTAAERRRLNLHGRFKTGIYRGLDDALLFIESEPDQAREIAESSGKPVLCFATQELFRPGFTPQRMEADARRFWFKARRKLRRLLGKS